MAFSQSIEIDGDVTIIRCSGPLVVGNCDELKSAAMEAIQRTGKVLLDLTGVPYMDSTGLGALAFLCVSARSPRANVKLTGVNRQIAEVLETTMLRRVLQIYPTATAAREAFAATA
jgi:anti-sigma B factor antagonist